MGCGTLLFGVAVLSQFNSILGKIEKCLQALGIIEIAEFVSNIAEVFCSMFKDVNAAEFFKKIMSISNALQNSIGAVVSGLGRNGFDTRRQSKWGPLGMTLKIKEKLSKFETKSHTVERTINSFQAFFDSIQKIDSEYETRMLDEGKVEVTTTNASLNLAESLEQEENGGEEEEDPDLRKVDNKLQVTQQQVINKEYSTYQELTNIGDNYYLILFFMILIELNELSIPFKVLYFNIWIQY
jgi:hypothetical protein